MNITKVKYERLFPCGAYLNEKIGFEAELSEPYFDPHTGGTPQLTIEQPQEVIEKLRQLAEDIHKEKYPHFYQDGNKPDMVRHGSGEIEPSYSFHLSLKEDTSVEPPTQEQAFKDLINSKYQTKKTLENLRPQVEAMNNIEITELFNNKLKTF